MHPGEDGIAHLHHVLPTRGLLGFRSAFLSLTRGPVVPACRWETPPTAVVREDIVVGRYRRDTRSVGRVCPTAGRSESRRG